MKVIFLDVDGVLNSEKSLMTDDSLEEELLLNLKDLVQRTGAKIILSSAWRFLFRPLRKLMERLDKVGLYISGMTQNGVPLDWLKERGFTPTNKYLDSYDDIDGNEIDVTTDRGAEIMKWLADNPVESFVILDDEAFDIQRYYPDNFIKTNFNIGLIKADVNRAIDILNRKD